MPSKTDVNPATGQMWAVNPATGNFDDNYWANVVEPQLKGMFPQQQTFDSILDAMNKKNEQFIGKIKEFDEKNPWVYDEILAEEMAKTGQRLDPYYKQTLDDFLTSINRKRTRSLEDERRTLSEISMDTQDYTKENKLALEDALEKSREGYADAGLYSSGVRMRAEGRLGVDSQDTLADYTKGQERRVGDLKLKTSREFEDYATTQGEFERDVGAYDPTGKFVRGVSLGGRPVGTRSEAEVRQYAMAEIPVRQQQREFERRQFAGPPAGADQAAYYLDTYSLLQ